MSDARCNGSCGSTVHGNSIRKVTDHLVSIRIGSSAPATFNANSPAKWQRNVEGSGTVHLSRKSQRHESSTKFECANIRAISAARIWNKRVIKCAGETDAALIGR